ncbi:alpha/beta hydrolase [Algisphaera agarilytica]|uniref:Acetyl esterase/lipase n=1 Tax=Algisphaera agarilytica TaxID=1385975 RepID=A0A7X0H721_9BACT|nr:alpha/beta hydrolase [Algisphaera agarilytica]MBB6430467.1 acetyl esterase/lipase [Algisphaera agarilytica]
MNSPAENIEARRNLVFEELPAQQLLLDLYRPVTDRQVPVVLYFHSGGWRSGNKDDCRVRWLTRYGFAVASVSYRLLPRYGFPSQIEDAKAAVRFLRGNAEEFGLHPEQFVASGLSSGAYLACMLGLTAGHPILDQRFEPDIEKMAHPGLPNKRENYSEQSTHVNAVINYSGLVDFIAIQTWASRRGTRAERSPEARLLGHAVHEDRERAMLASPMHHLHADAPPFMHIHGDRNEVTPLDQTRKFHAALLELGVTSKFTLVRGGGHNSRRMMDNPAIQDRVADFLHRHLGTEGGIRAVYEESHARTDDESPTNPIS